VHAPTEDSPEEDKDNVYTLLDREYCAAPQHDIKIILGDMNAKVGREQAFRPTIGKASAHEEINDNGLRLVDFAMDHEMTISSTYYPHKKIHKVTWKSPDGATENQIDYVLNDCRHGSDVMDVKTWRGADADSDHYLVVMKYCKWIANVKKAQEKKIAKFNVWVLSTNDTIKADYEQQSRKSWYCERKSYRAPVMKQSKVLQQVTENVATEAVGVQHTDNMLF
jgi:hypothetical protein